MGRRRKHRRMSKAEWLEHQASIKLTNKIVRKIMHDMYQSGKITTLANGRK